MKFEEGLKAVLKKIEINESDHNDFLDDVDTITSEINKAMEANNSIFKDMLKGLKTKASYRKDFMVDLPDNIEFLLDYKLPFKVKVVKNGTDLKLMTKVQHPFVRDGFVDKDIFCFLMQRNLELVISKMKPIMCKNDRKYKLNCTFPIITATEQVEIGCKITIDFNFSPVLSFDVDTGSQNRRYVFFVLSGQLEIYNGELQIISANVGSYFRDVYRLLKMLQIKYSDGDELESTMIVFSGILDSLYCKSDKTSFGSFFVETFKTIVTIGNSVTESLLFFGYPKETIFRKNMEKLMRNIVYFHLMDSVELDDMLALFKLS